MLPFLQIFDCLDKREFFEFQNAAFYSKYERHPSTPYLSNRPFMHDGLLDFSIKNINNFFGLSILAYKGCTIQRFVVGEKMDPHQDFAESYSDPNDYAPTVSMVYYLNDDYAGGEICFLPIRPLNAIKESASIVIKPEANSCVIFDANLWHWVMPIEDGERYSYSVFYNAVHE